MQNHQVLLIGGPIRSGTTVIHRALCTGQNTNPFISESWFLADIMRIYRSSMWRYEMRHLDQFGDVKNFKEVICASIRQYLTLVSAKHNDPELLVLKHPDLTSSFPDLAENFSHFKFLVIVRDPRDVIASMLRVAERHKESRLNARQSQTHEIIDFCKNYISFYENIFKRMRVFKNNLMFMKYEDFVSNTEAQLAKISKLSGAKYDVEKAVEFQPEHAKAAYFNREERMKDGFGSAFWSEQYTQSLTSEKIGAYKKDLNADQIKEIETRLQGIGQKFGYWGSAA